MTRFNAYYFDGLSLLMPPSRVITIEAADEDQAGRIAVSKMGRSLRVHVAPVAIDLPAGSTPIRQPRHASA
jgi:hypothetical protein